jgi:hypothetical protein
MRSSDLFTYSLALIAIAEVNSVVINNKAVTVVPKSTSISIPANSDTASHEYSSQSISTSWHQTQSGVVSTTSTTTLPYY